MLPLERGLELFGFLGGSWEQKSTKNRSKNGAQDGMHLGIDFGAMLVDFWSQVGRQKPPKVHPKRHRKNDAKKKGTKMAQKTLQEPTRVRGRGGRTQGEVPPL